MGIIMTIVSWNLLVLVTGLGHALSLSVEHISGKICIIAIFPVTVHVIIKQSGFWYQLRNGSELSRQMAETPK